jgi:hypothetical protein
MRLPASAPVIAVALLSLVAPGCGERTPGPAAPVPAVAPAPTAPPPTDPPPGTPPTSAPAPTPTPAPASQPVAEAPTPKVSTKKAPEPAREKLGAGQCRTCHRVQYDSWVKSGHARKGLDCEGCHGDGSEYATAKVMKDLAAAKAAGLIFQTASFCEKCHPTADATFLPKAHAHGKK